MMMITEDAVSFQKGLMDWLTEESEYLLQRLDRWTTIARGYNRLYPQRLSRGCMTMQKEPDEESWRHSPSFKILTSKRIPARPTDEVTKINCCGRFNYQSNSRVDNSCLEAYRYDHSIYFKTIGDIKSSKNNKQIESDDENAQEDTFNSEEIPDPPDNLDQQMSQEITWFDKNSTEPLDKQFSKSCRIDHRYDCLNNNNFHESFKISGESLENDIDNEANVVLGCRKQNKTRTKLTKSVKQPKVLGNNNVSWPGVLFSYNVDPALASSHHRVLNVK